MVDIKEIKSDLPSLVSRCNEEELIKKSLMEKLIISPDSMRELGRRTKSGPIYLCLNYMCDGKHEQNCEFLQYVSDPTKIATITRSGVLKINGARLPPVDEITADAEDGTTYTIKMKRF